MVDTTTNLTPLEQQVMNDYGKYVYKAVNVPANYKLTGSLPTGVSLVGKQLRVDPSSSLYGTKGDMFAAIQNANQPKSTGIGAFGGIGNVFGRKTSVPTPFSFNNPNRGIFGMGGIGGIGYTGMGGYNVANGFGGMGALGGFGRKAPVQNVATEVNATRNLDEALQEYLRKSSEAGYNMSFDDLKKQIETKRANMANVGVTAPQAVGKPMSIDELNAKYMAPQPYAHGGEVKGYAEGDLVQYDSSNPDFASQVQENTAANPLYAYREVPQVAQVPTVRAPSAVEEALAQRRAILADLNKALTAPPAGTTMTDAEKYWRLAAAFGRPGKSGHFAEGLANAGDVMADFAAEKRKEAKEQAGLALQRLQARSELATQQYGLAREAEMQDLLKKYLTKGQQVTSDVASGATGATGGSSVDNIPDDMKALILAQPTDKAVATIIDIAKENNKPSDLIKGVNFLVSNNAITREEGNAIIQENLQGKLEQVDVNVGELGGTYKMTGPEARAYYDKGVLPTRLGGAPKTSVKVASDVNNPSGIRKDGKFVTFNSPSEGISATHNLVSRYLDGKGPMSGIAVTPENVIGVWTNNDPALGAKVMGGAYVNTVKQELANLGVKLNSDGTIPNTPMAVTAVSNAIIKNEAGPNASKFLGGTSKEAAPTAGAAKPMSQEQVKAQETALQEQAKADIEEGKTLVGQKQFANDQINASKRVLGLVKTTPQAFGLTANPGLFNAVSSIVDQGVNTPWGSINLNVEEPLSKLKLKPEELQARRQAVQALTQIEIGYRKLFLKGEGAVSNMEGALAARLGPEIKDDPKTVQIKAGLIQIAAEKQNAIIEGYQKYKAQHPAAGPQAYYQTPEYQRIYNGYENKYAAFAKKAGIPLEEAMPSTPTKGGKLVDSLKNDSRWNNQ